MHFAFKVLVGIVVSVSILVLAGVILYFVNDYETGKGKFDYPTGIAVDKLGYIYVADFADNRIQRFDGKGNLVNLWSSDAARLAADSDGNIYALNADTQQVTKYTNHGLQLQIFKGRESPQTRGAVAGVALDSLGNVYWTNPYENKITEVAANGNFIGEWDSQQMLEGNATRRMLESMTIDSHDNMYALGTFLNAENTQI